ncbi:amidase family protein [Paenibacillus sp. FSL R7-0312]|uniref:amidase family protein n=1 Tax=Paenibacillus sp. FSL R7-0312 TaxID=2921682 RepID=UPI0030FBBFE3
MALHNHYGAFRVPELAVPGSGHGTLHDLSFTVKDVFAVAGHRSSAGNPDWLRSHEPAAAHAPAVSRLLQAGAALRGAAHTDELMYSLGGENYHYGTPVNPHGEDRIPGGSSSGSAVAVASGSVDFALGTDTGGSIRVPSAYCGVYGFRPTHGAVDMEGVIPLAPGFDTVGWMAGSAELLVKAGEVLLGQPVRVTDQPGEIQKDKQTGAQTGKQTNVHRLSRMFIPPECWSLAGQEYGRYLKLGLNRLQTGSTLQTAEMEIAPEGLKTWMDVFRELQGAQIWSTHGAWIEQERPVFGPDIAARFTWAAGLAGADHSGARSLQREFTERLRGLLGNDGCLVIPTVPGPAPLRGGDPAQLELNRSGAMMLSCIAGLAGLPQVTLPVAGPGDLPLGLSIIGGYGQDLQLLAWVQEVWKQ